MQDVQSCKDVPHKHQLVLNFTTLHNQIRSFSNIFEDHYDDPYLVHANGEFLSSFITTNTYCLIFFVGAKSTNHNKGLLRVLIEIVLDDLRAKWRYHQFRIHWYIPWLKTLLMSFLQLHKCHAMWYARMKMLPDVLYFLQSIDFGQITFKKKGMMRIEDPWFMFKSYKRLKFIKDSPKLDPLH